MTQPAEGTTGAGLQHALNLATGLVVFGALFLAWGPLLPRETGNPAASLAPGDLGPLLLTLLVGAGWLATLGALLAAPAVELAKRRLDILVGCAVMVPVVTFSLPATCGSGDVMERWRWPILGGLVLACALGIPPVCKLVRAHLEEPRGGLLVAAAFATSAAGVAAYAVLAPRANLHPALNLFAAFGVQLSLAVALRLLAVRRGWWKRAPRRALLALGGFGLLLALLHALGVGGGPSSAHARSVLKTSARPLYVLAVPGKALVPEWIKVSQKLAPRSVVTRRVPLDRVPEPRTKHDVLIVVVDALRRDAWGPERTPHLAALAAEGTVYTQASSPSPGTGHSLPAYLTGLPPGVLAQTRALPPTLPAVLERAGYRTRTNMAAVPARISLYSLFEGQSMVDLGYERVQPVFGARSGAEYDARTVDDYLARLRPDEPTLDYLHFMDTHGPFATRADYEAAVARADEQLGRIVSTLRERGLWERTVVLVFGDHGEGLGEHGMYQHAQALYAEQVCIPLVVRVPGRAPAYVAQPLSLTEVPALVLQALGADGWPAHDPPAPTSERAYSVQEHLILDALVWRAIRQPPYVYHRRYAAGSEELYDELADPGELRDLSAEKPEVLRRLRALEQAVASWEEARAAALNARGE